jgi:choice-of-anchor B domain-containing protein
MGKSTGINLKVLFVVVLLVAGTLGGATASVAHPGEEDGDKHVAEPELPEDWEAPDPTTFPGRPQTSVPSQSNRPRRHAPCVQGVAFIEELTDHPLLGTGAFPCDQVDLLSFFTNDEIGGGLAVGSGRGSDVWGWTDSETGREYVIAGLEVGTSFIDITDPKRPVYLAHLPTSATNNLIWRDIKVYADHAFIVAESANHGMQVFDLTTLRGLDPDEAPHTVSAAARYTGFLRAHNIAVNTDTAVAFAVGQRNDSMGCPSSMHMIDINDPADPTFAGCYNGAGYVHDAHCVVYDGPDAAFTGREICVGATPSVPGVGNAVTVTDVTDKTSPVTLSISTYPNPAYSHQGWLLDGHRYYLHNSESTSRSPQGIDIYDLADLAAPQHIGFFESPVQSTHHNLYQRGRYVFQSNYSSGLRVYDTRDVADGVLEEVAFFDVYPPHDNPGFGAGTWSNYPYFESGVVAVHGYQGVWIVRPRLPGS